VATTRSKQIQSWRNELSSREMLNGVNVRRFSALERGRIGWNALRFGNAGLRATGNALFELPILFGNGPLAPALGWHILRHGSAYDVVHLQTLPFAHIVYGYLCARASRRPVVITPHIHVEQPEVFDLAI